MPHGPLLTREQVAGIKADLAAAPVPMPRGYIVQTAKRWGVSTASVHKAAKGGEFLHRVSANAREPALRPSLRRYLAAFDAMLLAIRLGERDEAFRHRGRMEGLLTTTNLPSAALMRPPDPDLFRVPWHDQLHDLMPRPEDA